MDQCMRCGNHFEKHLSAKYGLSLCFECFPNSYGVKCQVCGENSFNNKFCSKCKLKGCVISCVGCKKWFPKRKHCSQHCNRCIQKNNKMTLEKKKSVSTKNNNNTEKPLFPKKENRNKKKSAKDIRQQKFQILMKAYIDYIDCITISSKQEKNWTFNIPIYMK